MCDLSFTVVETEERNRTREVEATKLGVDGLEFCTRTAPVGRFAWLEFELPGAGYRVKALAEIVAVFAGQEIHRVLCRFKHLFPRDRVAMNSFLEARLAA
jgi:hypothetical protein